MPVMETGEPNHASMSGNHSLVDLDCALQRAGDHEYRRQFI